MTSFRWYLMKHKSSYLLNLYQILIHLEGINQTILLGFVVFKLDMETILNAHFHLNGGVEFRVGAQCVDNNVQLFADVIESSDHCGSEKISASGRDHMSAIKKNTHQLKDRWPV